MRYSQIRRLDISNGEGLGISLFVSGCNFHCKNCFNSETWDFNCGAEWTNKTEEEFLNLLNNDHIKRVSILGGSPLCDENIYTVLKLVARIKEEFPDKKIWIYTGYTMNIHNIALLNGEYTACLYFEPKSSRSINYDYARQLCVRMIDVLVDGKYMDEMQDLKLKFRGSSNQRIIDIQESIKKHSIVLLGGNYDNHT